MRKRLALDLFLAGDICAGSSGRFFSNHQQQISTNEEEEVVGANSEGFCDPDIHGKRGVAQEITCENCNFAQEFLRECVL